MNEHQRKMSSYSAAVVTLFLVAATATGLAQAPATPDGSASSSVTHNIWTIGATMPVAAQNAMAAALGDKIYVVGGMGQKGGFLTNTQIYDPATNTWLAEGKALPEGTDGAAVAVVNGILYIIGGYTASGFTGNVYSYNPTKNLWTKGRNPMPTPRNNAGTAVEDNIIYVIGGNGSSQLRLDVVESYNPATEDWDTSLAPLLNGKSEPSVGRIGTTIVAADGFTVDGDTGDNESYSVADNTWTSLKADPEPRNEACAGAIGSEFYVAGGADNGALLGTTESFNLAENSWKSLASMPHATTDPVGTVYSGLLYCFGGGNSSTGGGTIYKYVQIYRP
jgi:large repetitive protein